MKVWCNAVASWAVVWLMLPVVATAGSVSTLGLRQSDALFFGLMTDDATSAARAWAEAAAAGSTGGGDVAFAKLNRWEPDDAVALDFAGWTLKQRGSTVYGWCAVNFSKSLSSPARLKFFTLVFADPGWPYADRRELLAEFYGDYFDLALDCAAEKNAVIEIDKHLTGAGGLLDCSGELSVEQAALALETFEFLCSWRYRCEVNGFTADAQRAAVCADLLSERLLAWVVSKRATSDFVSRYYDILLHIGDFKMVDRLGNALAAGFVGVKAVILRSFGAVAAGDSKKLNQILSEYPDFGVEQAGRLRFDAALAGRDFAAAENLLGVLPPHSNAALQLALRRGDGAALNRAGVAELARATELKKRKASDEDIDSAEKSGAQLLLLAAEKCRDAALFRFAEELLAPRLGDNPELGNDLGYTAVLLNIDLETARKRIQLTLDDNPNSSAALDSMAWLHYRAGRLDEAKKFIDMALRRAIPEQGAAEILNHAGDIALASGDRVRAAEYFRRALILAPCERFFNAEPVRNKLEALKVK